MMGCAAKSDAPAAQKWAGVAHRNGYSDGQKPRGREAMDWIACSGDLFM